MSSDQILPADSPLFEGRPDDEIEQIRARVAAATADHGEPTLHSIHCRLGLNTTTRQSHWDRAESKEATEARFYGVHGEPFGSATPSAEARFIFVNPEVQDFLRKIELGREFDVVFFLRPEKKPTH